MARRWMLNPPNRVRIRHIKGQQVTYLENPKVGTRTIESALWEAHAPGTAPENPHAEAHRAPFVTPEQMSDSETLDELLSADFFTVVRNPYTRFLSAYLDKVVGQAWEWLAAGFGFTPDNRPSPYELLVAFQDLDPAVLNPHFRLQHLTVFHGLAPLDHIGHIEDMQAPLEWLSARGVTTKEAEPPYSTGANDLVTKRLEGAALLLIGEFYAEDFERFGYAHDPRHSSPERAADLGSGTRESLREALSGKS